MEDLKTLIEMQICDEHKQHPQFVGYNGQGQPIITACCDNFHNKLFDLYAGQEMGKIDKSIDDLFNQTGSEII